MERLLKSIDKQIQFNRGKNLFFEDVGILQFANETVHAISGIENLNSDSKQLLINYTADKAIEEFCRVNQYYSFDSAAQNELREIYADLFKSLVTKTNSIEDVSKEHYLKLKEWLKKNNPFYELGYRKKNANLVPVACSEYNPEMQIRILQIDLKSITQPVLDIGCGSRGLLVHYLKKRGIAVLGIDRFRSASPGFLSADWLEYDYGKEKWGTVISNLGFSNHFSHHNLRKDGNFIGYGQAYVRILNSLKAGGCFHYAPDLPFIENFLDKNEYVLNKYAIDGCYFQTSVVKKIKQGIAE